MRWFMMTRTHILWIYWWSLFGFLFFWFCGEEEAEVSNQNDPVKWNLFLFGNSWDFKLNFKHSFSEKQVFTNLSKFLWKIALSRDFSSEKEIKLSSFKEIFRKFFQKLSNSWNWKFHLPVTNDQVQHHWTAITKKGLPLS